MAFQNCLEPSEYRGVVAGRARANTMEEFENFEGEKSSDPPKEEVMPKRKKEQIQEEYASFITLNTSDFEDSVQKINDRYERIQVALHAMCLLIQGICTYLCVAVPYPLCHKPQGFLI